MKVICPECNFSSEIPEDKIPANAQLATCPKCGIKFKFRDLEEPAEAQEMEQDQQAAYEQQEYSDLTPHTEEMGTQTEPEPYDEAPYSESGRSTNKQENEEENTDIWQRLDSMSPQEEPEESPHYSKEMDDAENEHIVPFEALEKYGFYHGILLTIKIICFAPAFFFRGMPLKGYLRPFIFYMLLTGLQNVYMVLWEVTGVGESLMHALSMGGPDANPFTAVMFGATGVVDYISILSDQLFAAVSVFPLVGLTHIMLLILGAGNRGYQATFRVSTYACAPMALAFIPLIGPLMTIAASLVISIIGYKNVHDTSYTRVILALLLPVIFIMVIAIGMGFWAGMNQPTI